MPYRIRRATVEDSADIWALLKETISWLRTLGTDQWSNWQSWEGQNGKVTRAIAAGSVWLLHDGRRLAATVTIEPYGDPDFWTEQERAEPALYISKLAVRRAYAGRGLGALLLNWARDRTYRSDADWARLDVNRGNERLRAYYLAYGWQHLRDVDRPGRQSGALFQLRGAPLGEDSSRLLEEHTRRHAPTKRGKPRRARWRRRRR